MRVGFGSVAAIALVLSGMAVTAHAAAPSEIGYVGGSLAVGDLINGRYDDAARILAAQSAEDARDPARMINLGIAYARMGRMSEAHTILSAAAAVPAETLILSDGREISSQSVAREQLRLLGAGSVAMR